MNSLSKEDLQNKIATSEKFYTTSTLGIWILALTIQENVFETALNVFQ